jgi:hypothetical protein
MFSVSKNTRHPQEAATLINFLTGCKKAWCRLRWNAACH